MIVKRQHNVKAALTYLCSCGLVVLPVVVSAAEMVTRSRSTLPNVLVLLADDLRPDGIAALGNVQLHTPNMDQIVREGLVFRNAYCFGSNIPAVCLPSRTMLLTGRVYFHYRQPEIGQLPSWPQVFRDAGYYTYHHGKRGNTPQAIHKHFHVSRYVQDDEDRRSCEPGKEIVDSAMDFLRNRSEQQPFFMYLAFANPHDPRVAAPHYRALYQSETIALPQNYLPQHPFNNGEMTVRDERLAKWPRTEEEIRQHLHDYYAVISGLDFHIGRLLRVLKEQNLMENTIIVLTSDHGLAVGSHGLMGKQNLYEHSMKAPLVMRGPGIRAGETEAFLYLHDLFPTLCELVGITPPENIDGRSAASVVRGERSQHREHILLCYRDVQRAVRDGRWKLIQYPHIHRTQLFDLAKDPYEIHDLAARPEQAQRIQSMLHLMKQLQQEVGDNLPLWAADKQDEAFVPPENSANKP